MGVIKDYLRMQYEIGKEKGESLKKKHRKKIKKLIGEKDEKDK